MAVTKTIALIGEIQGKERFLNPLAKNHRLLWVTNEDDSYIHSQSAVSEFSEAEVEIIACAKEGCWEADIIVLEVQEIERELIQRIREVATQKIVVVLGKNGDSVADLVNQLLMVQVGLPYSKIVEVYPGPEMVVAGKDLIAVETVEEILRNLGFSF
jgi:hypothetical protein